MSGRGLGQWQAYCVAAPTHEDYLMRLEEVPVELRDRVIRHCQTAAALAAGAAERARAKQEKRARVREGLGLGG